MSFHVVPFVVTLMFASAIASSGRAHADDSGSFVEVGHSVDYFYDTARSGFAKTDVDGDDIDDVVFIGRTGRHALFVLGRTPTGTIALKQSNLLSGEHEIVRLLGWRSGSNAGVIAIENAGRAVIYSGIPLREQRHFAIDSNALSAAVGDVNGDGDAEIVVLSPTAVRTYSLDSGEQIARFPITGARDIALAQLDADAAQEIILAGPGPNIVVDGATHAIEWRYIDGFGVRIATGHFGSDSSTQWVGAAGWHQYSVFGALPWTPLWSGATSQDITALAAGDVDADGRDEILVGDGQSGFVHVIDSATHSERRVLSHFGSGVNAIVAVDIDADKQQEIVFSPRSVWAGGAQVTVANGDTGTTEWRFLPAPGSYGVTAVGDVDGDGQLEVVAAGSYEAVAPNVAIFDFESGREEWRAPDPAPPNDALRMRVSRIALVPKDEGGMRIVLAGTALNDGRIVVLDGGTREVVLQIGNSASRPMDSRAIQGMQVLDYDGDLVSDFAVALYASTTGASGTQLRVFSGADGHPLWTSVTMGSGFSGINDVLLVDTAASGRQLVAVLPASLRAYSVKTGVLDWSTPVSLEGAIAVADGLAGTEIVSYKRDGAVEVRSADTRLLLRSFTLPAPLDSVSSIEGSARQLLVVSQGVLALVDGEDGRVLGTSTRVGHSVQLGQPPGVVPTAAQAWAIGTATDEALVRTRLHYSESIFVSSFDPGP